MILVSSGVLSADSLPFPSVSFSLFVWLFMILSLENEQRLWPFLEMGWAF